MTDVETAGAYLLERYAGETHEIVYELCLDRKGKLLACKRLNDGGASSAALDIRKVVENAILTSASTVILAHNHPSGIALPSDDDCAATTRARKPCRPSALHWRTTSSWRMTILYPWPRAAT